MTSTASVSIRTELTTVHFSDGFDSDAAAAILHRTARRRPSTGSRDTRQAVPGTRRFRRYLNALVSGDDSDSSFYSASDGEGRGPRRADEVEEEVWRSEWRGEFVAVGSDFFDSVDKLERRDKASEGGNRAHRRLQRMQRERRERRQQRKERLDRRQRRLAAAEDMGGADVPTPSSSMADGPFHESLVTGGPSSAGDVEWKRDEAADDAVEVTDDAMEIDAVFASNEALATDLWLQIEKPVRSVLKRLTDYSFIQDVEQLLLLFKAHEHQQQHSQTRLSSALFHCPLPPTPHYRVLPPTAAGELLVLMPEPFLRRLTYGALAFHFMHRTGAGTREQPLEDGLIRVRMQRGWIHHHYSLASYCQAHFTH